MNVTQQLKKSPFQMYVMGPKDWTTRHLKEILYSRSGNILCQGFAFSSAAYFSLKDAFAPLSVMHLAGAVGMGLTSSVNVLAMWRSGSGLRFSDYNPNSFKRRALEACRDGDIATLEKLNLESTHWNWKGFTPEILSDSRLSSMSPLEMAITYRNKEAVSWLLKHNAQKSPVPRQFYQLLKNVVEGKRASLSKIMLSFYLKDRRYWIEMARELSRSDYQLLLERASQDKKTSPLHFVDALWMRIINASPEQAKQDVLSIFEHLKEHCLPVQKARQTLEEFQTIFPETKSRESMEFLSRVVISYAEQHELENHLQKAADSQNGSIKSKRL